MKKIGIYLVMLFAFVTKIAYGETISPDYAMENNLFTIIIIVLIISGIYYIYQNFFKNK